MSCLGFMHLSSFNVTSLYRLCLFCLWVWSSVPVWSVDCEMIWYGASCAAVLHLMQVITKVRWPDWRRWYTCCRTSCRPCRPRLVNTSACLPMWWRRVKYCECFCCCCCRLMCCFLLSISCSHSAFMSAAAAVADSWGDLIEILQRSLVWENVNPLATVLGMWRSLNPNANVVEFRQFFANPKSHRFWDPFRFSLRFEKLRFIIRCSLPYKSKQIHTELLFTCVQIRPELLVRFG